MQFHWDRVRQGGREQLLLDPRRPGLGRARSWGAIALPRIGQEVIVSFLEGDPDRPIVTGARLQRRQQCRPTSFPPTRRRAASRRRSTKSGAATNFNELRFEDKKGEEQVYFHAEKDFERVVENDDDLTVDEGNQTIELKQGDRDHYGRQRDVTINMGNDRRARWATTPDVKQGNLTTKLDLGKSTTEAMQSIELKVGQNSVKIDQSGITIKGMMVKIEGSTMSEMKAPMTTINGDAMLTAKGGVTMIN